MPIISLVVRGVTMVEEMWKTVSLKSIGSRQSLEHDFKVPSLLSDLMLPC